MGTPPQQINLTVDISSGLFAACYPANPKLTIGALDPNDYEGTINQGYNGEFVPFGGNLTACSFFSDFIIVFLSIALPNADTYFLNPDFTGPIPIPINLDPKLGNVQYNCTPDSSSSASSSSTPPQSPYVDFTTSINGVDYQIDSTGNLLRPQSGYRPLGYCLVGIRNRSDTLTPDVVFGLPFSRSVYVTYRFLRDTCPGYYGFAFPSGSNRTQSQISQTPTSTPTNSEQCHSLIAPTSTPTASVVLAQELIASKETYGCLWEAGAKQVSLWGGRHAEIWCGIGRTCRSASVDARRGPEYGPFCYSLELVVILKVQYTSSTTTKLCGDNDWYRSPGDECAMSI
ncbi:hypothetical protein BU15DRAFT_66520 [Melanogaster broomeanus]|nr:hypothetical protein BU15DRAFT_66520 [Melanogaster broomeanus]